MKTSDQWVMRVTPNGKLVCQIVSHKRSDDIPLYPGFDENQLIEVASFANRCYNAGKECVAMQVAEDDARAKVKVEPLSLDLYDEVQNDPENLDKDGEL